MARIDEELKRKSARQATQREKAEQRSQRESGTGSGSGSSYRGTNANPGGYPMNLNGGSTLKRKLVGRPGFGGVPSRPSSAPKRTASRGAAEAIADIARSDYSTGLHNNDLYGNLNVIDGQKRTAEINNRIRQNTTTGPVNTRDRVEAGFREARAKKIKEENERSYRRSNTDK